MNRFFENMAEGYEFGNRFLGNEEVHDVLKSFRWKPIIEIENLIVNERSKLFFAFNNQSFDNKETL